MKAFRLFVLSIVLLILAGAVIAGAPPTVEEQNWARWRGPYDTGMAAGGARAQWSETENVKWKIDVPGKGLSSVVIWGDKIFLTTAVPTEPVSEAQPMRRAFRKRGSGDHPSSDKRPPRKRAGKKGFGMRIGKASGVEHRFEIWCINKNTGETLWSKVAKTATPHEGYHQRYGSFASNSPVTDGRRVYAYFGSRGIFAYDLDGNLIWEKDLGVKMAKILQFGEGTAPVLHGDTLLLKLDHQGDSVIVALDKNSGKELWRHNRDEMSSWSAPLVVEHDGRKQAIVSGTTKTRSYDLKTGEVIWEAAGLGRNVIPNPVKQNDTVFVMSGYRDPNLQAIRLGGSGDITNSDQILWTNQRANSYTASPVLYENRFYFATDNGFFSCLNATNGMPYYHQQRLPGSPTLKSSPVGAGGRIYIATENGAVIVLKMGEEFEVVSVNEMGDHSFIASPAILDGEIFLRSETSLFAISAE